MSQPTQRVFLSGVRSRRSRHRHHVTLTVSTAGSGSGTVTSTLAGITWSQSSSSGMALFDEV